MEYLITPFNQGRIFIISLGGGQIMGCVIFSLITGSLGGASRRLTRVNFSLTLGCSLGATLKESLCFRLGRKGKDSEERKARTARKGWRGKEGKDSEERKRRTAR